MRLFRVRKKMNQDELIRTHLTVATDIFKQCVDGVEEAHACVLWITTELWTRLLEKVEQDGKIIR